MSDNQADDPVVVDDELSNELSDDMPPQTANIEVLDLDNLPENGSIVAW